jgi:hypothetical protein
MQNRRPPAKNFLCGRRIISGKIQPFEDVGGFRRGRRFLSAREAIYRQRSYRR